jgi:hypothetical protein
MFEIGIFCVIVLAVSYWAVLWVMGRREDVLHGEFVEADLQADEPARSARPPSVPPIFRKPPARPVFPPRPAQTTAPGQPAFRPERLESLLNTIKQDLNQLVRK